LEGLVWTTRAIERLQTLLQYMVESAQPQSLATFIGEDARESLERSGSASWNLTFYPIPLAKKRLLLIANRV
jgi:hypothetical protein